MPKPCSSLALAQAPHESGKEQPKPWISSDDTQKPSSSGTYVIIPPAYTSTSGAFNGGIPTIGHVFGLRVPM